MLIDQLPEITTANDADEMPIEQGTTTRKIKILNLLKNVLKLTGGTLSGRLFVDADIIRRNNNLDVTSRPNAIRYDDIQFYGNNSIVVGLVRAQQNTDGTILTTLGSRRPVNGSNVINELRLSVSESGVKQITVTDPAAWRSALGLGAPVIANTQASIITPASGITIVGYKYAQLGKIGQLYLRWKSSSPITVAADGNATNVTVGTLVSGKRPAIFSVGVSMGDAGGPAFYCIADDGSVSLGACGGTGSTRKIAAGTEFYCMSTYILP